MTPKQKYWLIFIQTGISLGMLTWLFWRIVKNDEVSKILEGWNTASIFWVIGALLLTFFSFICATLRWQRIGLALHIREPGRKMFSHFMAGQFISNFLPTTVGGDVVRVTRLTRDTGEPKNSFASVILDRFIGWPILGIISLLGFGLNPGLIDKGGGSAATAIFISMGTILLFLLVSWWATHENTGKRLSKSIGILEYLSAIHIGLSALRTDPIHALQVLTTSFVMQFSSILAAGCAVEALNIHPIGLLALMAYVPSILIIQVLPISIGGFGVRETAFVVAFHTIGVDEVQSLQLGLMLGFMNLIVSLIGAPALAFGGAKSAPRDKMANKVQSKKAK